MSEVSACLFNNPYFGSIDTLLTLAAYRFSAFIVWLPFLLVFMMAALLVGFLLRITKSTEFIQHNPFSGMILGPDVGWSRAAVVMCYALIGR